MVRLTSLQFLVELRRGDATHSLSITFSCGSQSSELGSYFSPISLYSVHMTYARSGFVPTRSLFSRLSTDHSPLVLPYIRLTPLFNIIHGARRDPTYSRASRR